MHSVVLHSLGLLKQPFIVTFTSFVTLLVLHTTKHPTGGLSGSPSSHCSVPTVQSPSLHSYVSHTNPVDSALLRIRDASSSKVNIARLAAMNRIVRILASWRISHCSEHTSLLARLQFPPGWIISIRLVSDVACTSIRGSCTYSQLLLIVGMILSSSSNHC